MSRGSIRVAVVATDIAGPTANSAFGVPTPQEIKTDYQTVINSVNAAGGVACRKIVPVYFNANTADATALQQLCLQIQQAGVFMVIDSGGYYAYPNLAVCYPQEGLPYVGSNYLYDAEVKQFYPYLFGQASMNVLYRNTVFALKQRGYFNSPDFTKLGILYQDCVPQLLQQFEGWLQQVGISQSKIVAYDDGCPSPFAPPSQLQQAILKFEQNNVHHVTFINEPADFANFTNIAEEQGFRPHYGFGDDAMLAISKSSQHGNYSNIANAIAITGTRYGEQDTPGMASAPATQRCNAIYASVGLPPVQRRSDDTIGYGGWACNELWEFAAAVDHAPALRRTDVAVGLQAAGSVDFSWPYGPADFRGQGVTYGGQFWRTTQFFTSCDCWRVVDPSFHPPFP